MYLSTTVPSSSIPTTFYLTGNRKNIMDASLRGCSHVLFDSHPLQLQHSASSIRILDGEKKQKKIHRDAKETKKTTHTFTTVNNILSMICLYCHCRLEVKSLNSMDCEGSSLLSPLTRVWITSSKMLALSSSLLAMRRTVYTAPGLSPSITWKLWEVFTASEIRQLPSPSARSAQAASLC